MSDKMKTILIKAQVPEDFKMKPQYYPYFNEKLDKWERQKVKFELITPPTDEEIDAAAIEFVNGHCDAINGDLTVETECFDAGVVWLLDRNFGREESHG